MLLTTTLPVADKTPRFALASAALLAPVPPKTIGTLVTMFVSPSS